MWYVIQVRTGMEEEIRQQCERVIEKEILEHCFIPYCEQMKRYQGDDVIRALSMIGFGIKAAERDNLPDIGTVISIHAERK